MDEGKRSIDGYRYGILKKGRCIRITSKDLKKRVCFNKNQKGWVIVKTWKRTRNVSDRREVGVTIIGTKGVLNFFLVKGI